MKRKLGRQGKKCFLWFYTSGASLRFTLLCLIWKGSWVVYDVIDVFTCDFPSHHPITYYPLTSPTSSPRAPPEHLEGIPGLISLFSRASSSGRKYCFGCLVVAERIGNAVGSRAEGLEMEMEMEIKGEEGRARGSIRGRNALILLCDLVTHVWTHFIQRAARKRRFHPGQIRYKSNPTIHPSISPPL